MISVEGIEALVDDESVDLPPITMEQAAETRRLLEIGARIAAERTRADRADG